MKSTHGLALAMCGLTLLAGSTTGHAAKYRNIRTVGNVQLRQNVLIPWRQLTRAVDDAGQKSVRILSKKASEPWRKTVKQVLWASYVDDISVGVVRPSKPALARSVDALFEANATLALKPQAVRTRLTNAIFDAVRQGLVTVYAGAISGAFDMSYAHLTFRDRHTNQILSLFAGYSE